MLVFMVLVMIARKLVNKKEEIMYQYIRLTVITFSYKPIVNPGISMDTYIMYSEKKKIQKAERNLSSAMLLICLMLLFH